MTRFKLGLLSLSMAIIAACEPAFIAGEAEQFSRKIGLIDNYDISRWHGLIYSRDSHFSLAALVDDAQSASAILNAGQKGFSPYFASAIAVQATSVTDALKRARNNQANFLSIFYITEIVPVKNMKGGAIDTKLYNQVNILMSIYDVNSQRIVDKVSFRVARRSIKNNYSSNDKELVSFTVQSLDVALKHPMQAVAQELTGGR